MDRAFHSADNTRRDISGVKDVSHNCPLSAVTATKNGSNTFVFTTAASICYMTGRRCRFIVAGDAQGK
jgi:hypothetical protein